MSADNKETPVPEEVARASSPCLSLSPLRSPVDATSRADSLEEMLLADMHPEDKWRVAVGQAPRIIKKPPPQSSEASTSGAQSTGPPSPGRGTKRPALGEKALLIQSVADFEVSRGVRDGGEGWSETHSHQAVEELHQWLLQSHDTPAAPPPPYDRERCAQTLPPPIGTPGVEVPSGLRKGLPRHVRE